MLQAIESEGTPHLGHVSSAHGFMPPTPPPLHLPATHRAWDEAAEALPRMWRDMAARRELAALPRLSADPDSLPDSELVRASVVLSALAYSFARCDLDHLHVPAPTTIPECIAAPWRQVAERMGRRPHLAYDDMFTHNYRLIDPTLVDPIRLENIQMLVPLLGNETERSFCCTNTEIQARLTPVVEASVRAQEAAAAHDRDALVQALLTILESIRDATDIAFPKIDPNPHAICHADPVIWAKLTAPTGIPIVADVPGVSGAGSTGFQLIDTLLGRSHFASPLGGEAKRIRLLFAPNCRRFLDAVETGSLRQQVAASGDRELNGLFQSVLEAYAGDRGYLGVHRRKVYGFIESAFKTGRPATASGITGGFAGRTWRETDGHLEEARDERYREFFSNAQSARIVSRRPAAQAGSVQHIELDLTDTGIVYRPGDRVAILPEQTRELVDRTLASLRGSFNHPVPLTRAWREALRWRLGKEPTAFLALGDLLRFAELRPLSRAIAKELVRVSGSAALREIVERHEEDQLELWDGLELAAAMNYDVTRLWRAELWQDEAIARIVPPVSARMYSVASVPDVAPFPSVLDLSVGRLQFESRDARGTGASASRAGTASTFLTSSAELGSRVNVRVVRPLHFALPDRSRPIVLFAGGTGVAPFRAFVQARCTGDDAAPTWLFAAASSPDALPHLGELVAAARRGSLELRTAFSQADVGGAPRRRIDAVITEPVTAAALRHLLQGGPDGGDALFYVCGQAGFARSVLASLAEVAAPANPSAGAEVIRDLVGKGRLMTDLFTTFAPYRAAPADGGVGRERIVDASELVLHNDADHGWWTTIDGAVYDMTEFRDLHPGGRRIIDDTSGLDGTSEYRAVLHHEDTEIAALLDMYKIGFMRRIDFGRAWGVALHSGTIHYVTLLDAFKAWLRHLYLVVELQNSFRNDASVLDAELTPHDGTAGLTPLKLMLAADLHTRLLSQYVAEAVGPGLANLWALACGLLDPEADADELPRRLRGAVDGPGGRARAAIEMVRDVVRRGGHDAEQLAPLVQTIRGAGEELLATLKLHLRAGIIAFETHGPRTLDEGGATILGSLRAVPDALEAFYRVVVASVEMHVTNEQGNQQWPA